MSKLVIAAYNVGFGDAVLVSVPDLWRGREVIRHILIDVGNVLGGPASADPMFAAVARDILDRLDRRPVDLYVMTHEHLDHVRGLPVAHHAGIHIPVDYAWLTASAAEDYGCKFPDARSRIDLYRAEYQRICLALNTRSARLSCRALLAVNSPTGTRGCVDFLRNMARRKPNYVFRGYGAERCHPFHEARLSIWAPEEDSSDYYPPFRPITPHSGRRRLDALKTPRGVDAKAFRSMLAYLSSGTGDNLLSIDRAANNTSVVLCLEWRGFRLLFPGDAEHKSWQMMERHAQLKPVHFLKISHHGSFNGTPPGTLLEQILPLQRLDSRPRYALLSSSPGVFDGVPDKAIIRRLQTRVDHIYSTRSTGFGKPVEITFCD